MEKVQCPQCKGLGKVGTIRCLLCHGKQKIPQSFLFSPLEKEIADYIYENIPAGCSCPKCEQEIEPEQCVDDTVLAREDWVELVREVIILVRCNEEFHSNNNRGKCR